MLVRYTNSAVCMAHVVIVKPTSITGSWQLRAGNPLSAFGMRCTARKLLAVDMAKEYDFTRRWQPGDFQYKEILHLWFTWSYRDTTAVIEANHAVVLRDI